jgi:hypothetical protein
MSSGTDRIEAIADPVGLVAATEVNCYPPYGCDPLDFVGAGVGLGAGAGGDGGGEIFGEGLGVDVVGLGVGAELLLPGPLAGADRELADAEALGWVEVRADGEGDALAVGVAPGVAAPLAVRPVDTVLEVVPAALCAAVLKNIVINPDAASTLSTIARQVRLVRRRSATSRLALSFRCRMR